MRSPPLRSFHVENFKSIREGGITKFGWLTVFIGDNGVGKSSMIEAIETHRDIIVYGVDAAFSRWKGFEHVWNKSKEPKLRIRADHRESYTHAMGFRFRWKESLDLSFQQVISPGPGGNSLFIEHEQLIERYPSRTHRWTRNDKGVTKADDNVVTNSDFAGGVFQPLRDGDSLFTRFRHVDFRRWQFLMLNPDRMGLPATQSRASSVIRLTKDGANLAEYLNDIRSRDLSAFEGILEALRYVLPYAADLQPTLTSEVERAFYLKLKEQNFEIPGWLLSTGTLRTSAFLSCLRHPEPPTLLVVEEIENGLDPRTLNLVVEEIRAAVNAGKTQVILTTHSPYLLDLLDLSHIVVVEREDGQTIFRRPDEKQLAVWSKSFSPGRLYTMGRLTRNG